MASKEAVKVDIRAKVLLLRTVKGELLQVASMTAVVILN